MKKLLITIGSLLIMTFVVVLFVNATESKKDTKKAKTEVKKTEAVVPCSATCTHSTGNITSTCDPEKCKEMNCDPATCTGHKDGKCDPATCAVHKEGGQKEGQVCAQATACPGTCHTKTTAVK